MTSPANMTVEELLKSVVDLQAKAAAGDAKARDALAGMAAGTSKNPIKTPEPEPEAPKVTLPTIADKFIVRPNGQQYWIRKVGAHQDVGVMRKCRETKQPALLYGVPGCGKTALFEAAFTTDGFEYVPGSGDTEVSDFIGGYVPLPAGEFEWVDGPLVRAMENGLPLLVDEVALIDPKVMAVVYSVMDGRGELNVTANPSRAMVKAQEGFVVFGACNPRAPGARMSEALLSRFAVHVEVSVDFKLMAKLGVPAKFVDACSNLHTKFLSNEVSWFPAIREMLAFKKVAEAFGDDTALSNVVAMAPELDRKTVQDVLSRSYGSSVKPLRIA